jgi:S-adenosylmethionine decarboxylase
LAGLRRAKVVEKKTNFGVHLTLDGYRGNKQKLNSFELVFNILDKLPEELNMKKLTTPYVVFAPPVSEKDQGGFSGFIIINESHISIHTFPKKNFVSIDVYTCGSELDSNKIINYFKEAFELEETEINIIKRGTKFLLQ